MFSSTEKNEIWKKLAELGQNAKTDKIELLNQINANETISKKEAAYASKKTSEFRNRAQGTLSEASVALDEIILTKANIEKILEEINLSKIMLSETLEQQDAYLIKIKEVYEASNKLQNGSSEAMAKINQILEDRDNINEAFEGFQASITEGEDNNERIQHVLNQTISKKKEIDTLHQEIFGFQNEEEHVNGKKHDLDEVYTKLKTQLSDLSSHIENQKAENDVYYTSLKENTRKNVEEIEHDSTTTFGKFIEESRSIYDGTHNKIKDLLPKALTAGLASAYDLKIDKEELEGKNHKKSFMISIGLLTTISLVPFAFGAYRLQSAELAIVIQDMPNILAIILPVYFPVVWLAYSANKSYKLSKRLVEEYTHKGVLSKTFEGLSTQIKDIEQKDISAELRVKLLYNLVEVNSENPGKLISDYNKSDHPLMDALDKSAKLANSFEKLGKIPGLSAIAKKVDNQISAGLKEKDEKMTEVINNMSDPILTTGLKADEAENDSSKDNRSLNR